MGEKTKPTFSPDQDMMNITPEDVAEAKRRTKEREAYNRSMVNTPAAPKPEASAPAPKRLAAGGSVSASKRADGIAQRGKTRGKMC